MERLGLVLTGGGARAAYQAGVLRGIADAFPAGAPMPFQVITGASAGAINAVALGGLVEDFKAATGKLWDTWSEISSDQVFRSDPASILTLGRRWARDLALGGALGGSVSTHLLDTSPLRDLVRKRIDLDRVAENVQTGRLHAVSVSATSYGSGAAVSFFDAAPDVPEWTRSARLGVRARLRVGHVLASAAIPVFFPPEAIDGSYWGDGCIRLTAPLSPAIHLGADRVLAIGIRHQRSLETARAEVKRPMRTISAVDIGGVLLNAVFLDSLEGDLERMRRINRTVGTLTAALGTGPLDGLREIPVEAVLPSQDLGLLAASELGRLPRTLRYMLRGLGASDETGWDLLSYLAFDRAYTRPLLEIGRADAHAHAGEISTLLAGAQDLRSFVGARTACVVPARPAG